MTDYKTLFGKKIKFQTSDLTMSTATEGEVFYSDTDKGFKVGVVVEAWASGGDMNVARRDITGFGIQTAAVACGGRTHSPPGGPFTNSAKSEEYNGSAWANGNDSQTSAGSRGGAGTLTAGLVFGGGGPGNDESEEYDGTSYTEGNDLTVGRSNTAGCGTQTAALAVGGVTTVAIASAEEYDGTSWTAVTAMPAARNDPKGLGLQTAALVTGGDNAALTDILATSLEYDGTNWTDGGALLVKTRGHGTSGTQTAGLMYGGGVPAVTTNAAIYDGTSFRAAASMATARIYIGDLAEGSTTSAALVSGGFNASNASVVTTEEFAQTVTLKTVTDS